MTEFLLALLEYSRTAREILSNTTLSTVIGTFVLAAYLVKNRSNLHKREVLINAAAVFGGSLIILPGLGIMLLGYDKETCDIIKVDQKFIVVGGFILAGLGYQTLTKNYNT